MSDQSLARMFWNRVEKSAGSPAQKFKRQGTWKTLTWREVGNTVRDLTAALVTLGRRPGDAVGILSTSRAEWVQADFAIFSTGGVTIPIYPTYPPDLIEYIVNDAGVKTLIVEDPSQLAKVLEVDKSMPGLEHIVIMQGYEGRVPSPRTFTWEALQRLGREKADSLKAELAKRVDGIKQDVATIVTPPAPPGRLRVVQTGNHLSAPERAARHFGIEGTSTSSLPRAFSRARVLHGVHRGLRTVPRTSTSSGEPPRDPPCLLSVPRCSRRSTRAPWRGRGRLAGEAEDLQLGGGVGGRLAAQAG
jgi:hypothetical protein